MIPIVQLRETVERHSDGCVKVQNSCWKKHQQPLITSFDRHRAPSLHTNYVIIAQLKVST